MKSSRMYEIIGAIIVVGSIITSDYINALIGVLIMMIATNMEEIEKLQTITNYKVIKK